MPLLSITIPTFNRRTRLAKTLAVVVPQLSAEVEILVWDNCSTDDTVEYVSNLLGPSQVRRQETNVGLDRNFLTCLERFNGEYVWLLCDDDLLCSNAVAEVLGAIERFGHPPVVYVKIKGSDLEVSDYTSNPVATSWKAFDQNGLLNEMGYFFTFGSSMIIRRDRIDVDFVRKYIGTAILPAAALLAAAAVDEQSIISDQPLLYARGGNAGGYDAFTVFSKNIVRLFNDCARIGYRRDILDKVYNENLAGVMIYIVNIWPMTFRGFVNLFSSSWGYKSLYTRVLPALGKRFGRPVVRPIKRVVRRLRGVSPA